MTTGYKFVLIIMVNDVTCNDIVDSVSTMTAFSAKSLLRQNWVVYICYITFIESDYFLWVKKTTIQNRFIKIVLLDV